MSARAGGRPNFVIGDAQVSPGSRAHIELPIARMPHGAHAWLPCVVVHGRRPGPVLWLSGAVHGDELTGVEVVRQLLEVVSPRTLSGTLVCAPMVNIFGAAVGSRYLPDRRDLNRSFPGSARGSLAGRLAQLFLSEVVQRCDVGIDMHSGSSHRRNYPHVRANLDDPETYDLARAFGPPVVIDAPERSGSLRAEAARIGKPVLLFEGGGPHRYHRDAVDMGVLGTRRVMAHLGMTGPHPNPATAEPIHCVTTRWCRAAGGGLFRSLVELGETVELGQVVGKVADAFGATVATVRARTAGIVIGLQRNPIVFQGDALVHIAIPEAPPGDEPAPDDPSSGDGTD